MQVLGPVFQPHLLLTACAGLGANEDVFELIKQEVQRDVAGRKRLAAGGHFFTHAKL